MSKLYRIVRITYVETVKGVAIIRKGEGVVIDDLGEKVRVKISLPSPHEPKIIEVPTEQAPLRFPGALRSP